MYGLRKIRKDGTNEFNDFVWPLTIGAEVEAPDWNPKPYCGGGLHCLPNAQGYWRLLKGEYWAVLEFDEKEMVQIDKNKSKIKKCKIVFLSENPEGMLKYFDVNKFNSETAYWWAYNIGNRDIMIDRVKDSEWAFYWGMDISSNQDIMIGRVTESRWAYWWAFYIGNKDIMIDRITESDLAYQWGRFIGNRDIMIQRFPELKKRLQ